MRAEQTQASPPSLETKQSKRKDVLDLACMCAVHLMGWLKGTGHFEVQCRDFTVMLESYLLTEPSMTLLLICVKESLCLNDANVELSSRLAVSFMPLGRWLSVVLGKQRTDNKHSLMHKMSQEMCHVEVIACLTCSSGKMWWLLASSEKI